MPNGSHELEPGRAAFNRGDYFLAHELWEEVWHEVGDAERRVQLQGLIQVAAGLHHLQKHRIGPGVSLLRKGLEKLSRRPKDLGGSFVDLRVDLLAARLERLLVELDASTTEVTAAPDLGHIKL